MTDCKLEHALAYLLDLRIRTRGAPEAQAFVDRALALLARAQAGDTQVQPELDALADDLARRFGAPKGAPVH